MIPRYAIMIVTLLAAGPTLAESLDADAARRFVLGKLFAFTCFDGSRGAGRVYDDGSVVGTIQVRGSGPVHSVWLPAGTLKVKGGTVCASLNGIPIEPCFDLNRTDSQSFRGSVLGINFAYCDFTHRLSITSRRPRPQLSEPLSLDPTRRLTGAGRPTSSDHCLGCAP
jgi:hypothetical protein